MRDLNNMTVMITGASSGFGMVTAKMLVEQGANVVLGARRADRLEALSQELGEENVPLRKWMLPIKIKCMLWLNWE